MDHLLEKTDKSIFLILVVALIVMHSMESGAQTCSQVFFSEPLYSSSIPQGSESPSSAIVSIGQIYGATFGKRLTMDQISEVSILSHYAIKEIGEGFKGKELLQSIQAIELMTRVLSHPDIAGLPQSKNEKEKLLKVIVQIENEMGPIKTARVDLFRNLSEFESLDAAPKAAEPVKGFWRKLWSRAKSHKFSAEEVQRENPQISLPQLQYMLKFKEDIFNLFEAVPKIEKISINRALNLTSGDMIKPLYAFEKEMLALSAVDQSPREVLRLYFIGKNQESLISKPMMGAEGSVEMPSFSTFRELLRQAAQQLSSVEGVVITHTHPVYNIVMNGTHVQMTPLSAADLHVAAQLSQALGKTPLTIRAVVPNGFAFERRFVGGKLTH